MESKSQKASPAEDAGGDADAEDGASANSADANGEQPASGGNSEGDSQAAGGGGEGAPDARKQPGHADFQRMHQAAARLETAVADAERERHQWQELPRPVARHSIPELLLVTVTTGAFVSVVFFFVLWGAGVLTLSVPSFLGGAGAATAQQEQRAGGGAMSAQRISAAYERFSASEQDVWNRDCRPLQEQLAGQGADALTESERATWQGQCRQMVANMLE